MICSFELIKHANIRYRDHIAALSLCELHTMLSSLGISSDIRAEKMGGSEFLTFECRELNEKEITFLAGHSAVAFMAENVNGLLRPLPVVSGAYLPDDLPEVLKYKGKTSVSFSRFMINTAAALSSFAHEDSPLTFYDPVCGKGTACFCAAAAGMNAVGLDFDRKEIREASDYFSRYLKFHRLKHETLSRSETNGKHSLQVTEFRYAAAKESFQAGDVRFLRFACADTSESPALFRKGRAHIAAADLPYGIQHAPRSGTGPESLHTFLERVLPVWKQVLRPGGVLALSFNTLTLPSRDVRAAVVRSGFRLPEGTVWDHLSHEVEHAVVRDVIFALNTEEDSSR